MDFIDGTMYIKYDGQLKPFTAQYNGYAEGYQTKAYGQYSHAEGVSLKNDNNPKIEISAEMNKYESTISELQEQIKVLKSQMEEATSAIKELKEEIDKINKRDAFDRYFGVDYSNSKDF